MFCNKCGNQLKEDAMFCNKCGSSRLGEQPPAQANANENPNPNTGEAEPSFFKKWWKIAVPAAAVLVLATAVLAFSTNEAPLISVGRALENVRSEAACRLNSSPIRAAAILADSLDHGTITVSFDHRDRGGFPFAFGTSGSVILASDAQNSEYALEADVSLGGFISVDLEAHLNSERLAARSGMIGADFYGITFSTFRSDIRSFGGIIGLNHAEMDEMSDLVEALGEQLSAAPITGSGFLEPYVDIFTRFFLSLNYESVPGHITTSDGDELNAAVFRYVITQTNMRGLLANIYTQLQNDETLRSSFDFYGGPLMQDLTGPMLTYDEFLREIRDAASEFGESFPGDITLTLRIVDNRLFSAEADFDLYVYGEPNPVYLRLNLGTSVNDPWTLVLSVVNDHGDTIGATIGWIFDTIGDSVENRLRITTFGPDGADDTDVALSSSWSQDSGRFTLAVEDGRVRESISGTFIITDDGGFNLRPDAIDLGGQSLTLEISTVPGADIRPIEFINLDRWDQQLLNTLTSLLGFIF